MPNSIRRHNRLRLERAIKHLIAAQNMVVVVGQQYKERYPEIYDAYCELVANLDYLKDLIEKVKNEM